MRRQLGGDGVEQLASSLRMGKLPAAHTNHDLHFVAGREELLHGFQFCGDVVLTHIWAEPNLLQRERLLALVGFALPLALLELEASVVEQFADWRRCRWVDFDEIQMLRGCEIERLLDRQDAERSTLVVDYGYLSGPNPVIYRGEFANGVLLIVLTRSVALYAVVCSTRRMRGGQAC